MLRGGTTTLEAKSGYGLDCDTELRMLRVIARLNAEGPVRLVATLLAAHTVPLEFQDRGSGGSGLPPFAQKRRVKDGAPGTCGAANSASAPRLHGDAGRVEYVRWIVEELIPEVAAAGAAKYCDAFCDDHAFTVDEARAVLTAAKRHGMGLRLHAEQFTPGTGAALAAELGAATADHLEMATEEALALLRDAGVQPVLLPGSVFALGRTQYPPARKMVEMGLAIVLATDFNPGSSPVASMPFMLSLACVQMGLMPAEALTAATINAAWSLGMGEQVGSLEAGKQADFLVHEFADYRELAYFIAAPTRPRAFIAGREMTL
jgi:imidazolonepropionase